MFKVSTTINHRRHRSQRNCILPEDHRRRDLPFDDCAVFSCEGPAAEFVRPLENIEVTENNEAIFECQLNTEDAQVEWWFRGMPLVPSPSHLIASRGFIRQLIIPKIAMSDEGEYSIRVDNKNTSTAQLFVKGRGNGSLCLSLSI